AFIIPVAANRHFSRGSPTCTTAARISGAPSMRVNVVWRWKVEECPQPTASSICRSSPPEAFAERRDALLNRVEGAKSFLSGSIFASKFTKGQCRSPGDHWAWEAQRELLDSWR